MRLFIILFVTLLLYSCYQTPISPLTDKVENTPLAWEGAKQANIQSTTLLNPQTFWPKQYNSDEIEGFIQQAINNNIALQQAILSLDIQRKQLNVAQANLLPSLSLDFTSNRQKRNGEISNNNTLNLSGSYEIDIWGKLSAQEQVQSYEYLSAKSAAKAQLQQLISSLHIAYANAIEAQQLHTLFAQKSVNSAQGLKIIEDGYKQGLNSALDVYLARNELNSDLSRETQQTAITLAQTRVLERIMGLYPSGKLSLQSTIPV